jgi:transposase-like protein
VWLYYRFGVSLRDVSELMLARGIEVSHEAIRLWTLRFAMEYARRLRRTQGPCSGIVKTFAVCSDAAMSQPSTRPTLYKGYRFPPEIISRCVWLYYRFGVSLRDVSELMLARGIEVSHEAIRLWTLRFGTEYARRLRRAKGACANISHLDELCLMINGGARLGVAGCR